MNNCVATINDNSIVIDQTPVEPIEVVKYERGQIEEFMGKWRIAYAKCPQCGSFISIYKDDLYENGNTGDAKKCTCGFNRRLDLSKIDFNI